MQWFSWNEQSECWVPAHSEFSKLFKCEDSIGAGTHHSFKFAESGPVIDGPSINGAHDMNRGSLFYHAPVADKISVALCLVGEARESTFQQFNGMPPVSTFVRLSVFANTCVQSYEIVVNRSLPAAAAPSSRCNIII